MTKLLSIIIIALMLIQNSSSSKYLKSYKQDTTVKSIIHDLIVQNNLKGFAILNCTASEKSHRLTDVIIRQTLASATATSVNTKFDSNRYNRNLSRFIRINRRNKGFAMQLHMASSDNTFTIVIIDENSMKRANLKNTIEMMWCFETIQAVSKGLLIFISNNERFSLNKVLPRFVYQGLYNLDLLVIRSNVRGEGISRFTVYQSNPFSKVNRRFAYKPGVRFFRALPQANLNKYPLKVWTILRKRVTIKRLYAIYDSINESDDTIHYKRELYPVETAVERLNATCKFALRKDRKRSKCNIGFALIDECTNVLQPLIFHPSPKPMYFFAPSVYDQVKINSYQLLLFSLFTLASSLFVFWLFSRWYNLDAITWDPIAVFSMIIGMSNPRDPVHFAETAWFFTVIVMGFFAGSELIFGMTSATVTWSVERDMETLSDLADNNVTLAFTALSRGLGSNGDSKRIKYIELDTDRYQSYFESMIRWKNLSVSFYIGYTTGAKVPRRFRIDGVNVAKESRVQETNVDMSIKIERNMPWTPKLRQNFVKFHECGLFTLPVFENHAADILNLIVGRVIENLELEHYNNDERMCEPVENFFIPILIGCSISLAVLAVELAIAHYYKDRHQISAAHGLN